MVWNFKPAISNHCGFFVLQYFWVPTFIVEERGRGMGMITSVSLYPPPPCHWSIFVKKISGKRFHKKSNIHNQYWNTFKHIFKVGNQAAIFLELRKVSIVNIWKFWIFLLCSNEHIDEIYSRSDCLCYGHMELATIQHTIIIIFRKKSIYLLKNCKPLFLHLLRIFNISKILLSKISSQMIAML